MKTIYVVVAVRGEDVTSDEVLDRLSAPLEWDKTRDMGACLIQMHELPDHTIEELTT